MTIFDSATTLEQVKEYYGKTLRGSKDLKTNACCCATDAIPNYLREILRQIDNEIVEKFYGCGSPIPLELAGRTVLDLGCGTGRDVFMVSKLVGPRGRVIGVDMTEEQLAVARRHVGSHTGRFGFPRPNVDFRQGYIEDLHTAGIEDESVDVVISNCVINLSPDKRRVFSGILRVLKPGGELYFSDVFADRRIPNELAGDPLLRGECLGGALYVEDFRRLLAHLGCPDFRTVSKCRVTLDDADIRAKAGMINFDSMTVRAFKLSSLEDCCEDYGQAAIYRGTIPESPHRFVLDDHHTFVTGKPLPVCGNSAAMLCETRFGRHFQVIGDRSRHYGLFNCSASGAADASCC
jgi:SAM-dependent methyltransferase